MTSKVLFVEYCADDFLGGTANMDAMTELAYRRICDLIYSTNDNLLDNDSLQYATKTGSKWKKIRKDLIAVYGKIFIEDGYIRVEKCTEKLQKSRDKIAQKSDAGKLSAKKRKALKNNKTTSTGVEIPLNKNTAKTPTEHQLTKDPITNTVTDTKARASENDVSRESPKPQSEVMRIGNLIAEITGWANDPRWFGDYARVDVWLKAGWDVDLDILPTVRRLTENKLSSGQAVPTTLNYFEKAIADAYARRNAPVPEGNIYDENRGRTGGFTPAGDERTGNRRSASRYSDLAAAESETERIIRERTEAHQRRISEATGLSGKPEPADQIVEPMLHGVATIRENCRRDGSTGQDFSDGSGGLSISQNRGGIPRIPQIGDGYTDTGGHSGDTRSVDTTVIEGVLQPVGATGS